MFAKGDSARAGSQRTAQSPTFDDLLKRSQETHSLNAQRLTQTQQQTGPGAAEHWLPNEWSSAVSVTSSTESNKSRAPLSIRPSLPRLVTDRGNTDLMQLRYNRAMFDSTTVGKIPMNSGVNAYNLPVASNNWLRMWDDFEDPWPRLAAQEQKFVDHELLAALLLKFCPVHGPQRHQSAGSESSFESMLDTQQGTDGQSAAGTRSASTEDESGQQCRCMMRNGPDTGPAYSLPLNVYDDERSDVVSLDFTNSSHGGSSANLATDEPGYFLPPAPDIPVLDRFSFMSPYTFLKKQHERHHPAEDASLRNALQVPLPSSAASDLSSEPGASRLGRFERAETGVRSVGSGCNSPRSLPADEATSHLRQSAHPKPRPVSLHSGTSEQRGGRLAATMRPLSLMSGLVRSHKKRLQSEI